MIDNLCNALLADLGLASSRLVRAQTEQHAGATSARTSTDSQPLKQFNMSEANKTQVAGSHYKQQPIQPWDYIAANELGYFEGNIVKYVSRWRAKGGVDDLRKAQHYLQKLIEMQVQPKQINYGKDHCDFDNSTTHDRNSK